MQALFGLDIQRAAVWLLGVGLVVNTVAIAFLSGIHDGNLSPTLISALADTQHYIVGALALAAGFHGAATLVSTVKTGTPPQGAATGAEASGGAPNAAA